MLSNLNTESSILSASDLYRDGENVAVKKLINFPNYLGLNSRLIMVSKFYSRIIQLNMEF